MLLNIQGSLFQEEEMSQKKVNFMAHNDYWAQCEEMVTVRVENG